MNSRPAGAGVGAPVNDDVKAEGNQEAWTRICRRLRSELGEDVFSSWFGRLELDGIADGSAVLSVPTKFLKSWIESHYCEKIWPLFESELPEVKRVSIRVRSSRRPSFEPSALAGGPPGARGAVVETSFAPSVQKIRPDPKIQESEKVLQNSVKRQIDFDGDFVNGSPLDRRLNFSSFLVGRSNQLAHAAAQKVASASADEPLLYNPLYLHATVGLGKTHLLHAVAHAATAVTRRVIYLTAERFMYGFVSALKAQTAIAFKEKLRSIDVLVIDDVQFLQGKSIQQEFCHTLNALIDARRQIVIAADRPPGDLESLDERVRSRLAGGLCVEMGGLDESLRIKILEARIAAAKQMHPNFEVPASVIGYVASAIQTNGRDLDGAVNRLLAHASLNGAPIGLETAELAIRDLVRTHEPKRIKIEDIQKLVASHFNVSRADILSARRTANVVRPRQIAMYLSKMLTLRSLPEIGRRFGGRDHTTVLHAVRKIETLATADGSLSEELELLKRMLME
ncbi:chromosomal replication initiator protein DnaA [Methylocapsa palsarum]|uniref:Chromosomal replication initiator protein DnaA n=1 Tax=Methylocapsa palsarum TaxID=1612308 RepID=A0A1I3W3D6_9HYPH|nr:chromosomal replication initiator protein DnaA [Methylocapsa palsarum]SFK01006.1 chromosomal replication initiator protein [Methylocapsa palsarum]